MGHPKTVQGFISMEELAITLADLDYSALQDLFATLADEIRENAKEDEIKDRYNLAYALNEAAGMLYLAAEEMSFAASMQPSSAKEAAMT